MRDLIIIGGGPGGYVAAIRARQLGLSVTLFEREALGGTCLNVGCIPTKAYYKSAEIMRQTAEASLFGLKISGDIQFNLLAAKQRKDTVVGQLVGGVQKLLKAHGVEVIFSTALLEQPGRVVADGEVYEARNIIIATGSQNKQPPIAGMDNPRILDSTTILQLDTVPERLTVVGGGVIGMEFAGIFRAFGSTVTVVEAADTILAGVDQEIVKRFGLLVKKQGINVITGALVEKAEASDQGICLHYRVGTELKAIESDYVLMSIGRKPSLEGIDVKQLGIIQDAYGFLKVDAAMQTNVPGIYAIGDVIGGYLLAHVASEEGIAAVENIAGHQAAIVQDLQVPNCIFTFPEISSVGLSEEEAKMRDITYRKGKFSYAANGKAMCLGETDGLIKVLADEKNRIIGIHILGAHASDLILEATVLIQKQVTLEEAAFLIHPHPTLGEILKEAILDVEKKAIHQISR